MNENGESPTVAASTPPPGVVALSPVGESQRYRHLQLALVVGQQRLVADVRDARIQSHVGVVGLVSGVSDHAGQLHGADRLRTLTVRVGLPTVMYGDVRAGGLQDGCASAGP